MSQNKDICSYSFIGNNADLIWQPQTSRTIKKMREMLDLTVAFTYLDNWEKEKEKEGIGRQNQISHSLSHNANSCLGQG